MNIPDYVWDNKAPSPSPLPSVPPSSTSAADVSSGSNSSFIEQFYNAFGTDPSFFDDLLARYGSSAITGVDELFGTNSAHIRDFLNDASDRAFDKSQSSADKLMEWQERMSASSMQRRMADLRAAGLNPKLAYQLGGADIGSGATASYDSITDSLIQALTALLSNATTKRGQDLSQSATERGQDMSLLGQIFSSIFKAIGEAAPADSVSLIGF